MSMSFGADSLLRQLVAAYPRLTEQAIAAALDFAAQALRADVVYPIAEQTQ